MDFFCAGRVARNHARSVTEKPSVLVGTMPPEALEPAEDDDGWR